MTDSDGDPEQHGVPKQRSDPAHALNRLLSIMAALRHPDTGCPWDIKQTFASIAPYTIEEAYEVADAIERRDMADLRDELGDLLLQVVYHAQMAAEQTLFDFADVAEGIAAKLIRRHPHVFGGGPSAEGGSADRWEAIKRQEREEKARRAGAVSKPGLFDDIPAGLPALLRSAKLQKQAAKVGFDWPDVAPLMAKVDEELAELRAEISAMPSVASAQARLSEEFGDLLFVLVNLGLHLGVDADAALRSANAKFIRRMNEMEHLAEAAGRSLSALPLDELEALWRQAKRTERAGEA